MKAPGPWSPPLVGALRHLSRDPLTTLPALRDRYGGVVALGAMGPLPLFLVSDVAAIKHVLLDNARNYKKGRAAQRMAPILGRGSLLLEGDEWARRRRLIKPAFHRDKIAELGEGFVAAAVELVNGWRPLIAAGRPIDVRAEMLKLTMTLTVRNMFRNEASGDLGTLVAAWQTLYDELTQGRFALLRPPRWVPTAANRRLAQARADVRRILDEYIRAARRRPLEPRNLLSMLVHARDEDGSPGMSDEELRAEVTTLFVGGYETSSTALSFTLGLLAAHPEVAAAHRAELAQVLAGRRPSLEDLARLPLNAMILRESMRLYPPSWVITREAIAADTVAGYAIPKGAQLLVSAWVVHRDARLWPDPTRFEPRRFASEREAEQSRFAYLPFGGGPRMCVGDQYSLTEMQLVLAVIGQDLELALAPGSAVRAAANVGLRPAGRLELIARPAAPIAELKGATCP